MESLRGIIKSCLSWKHTRARRSFLTTHHGAVTAAGRMAGDSMGLGGCAATPVRCALGHYPVGSPRSTPPPVDRCPWPRRPWLTQAPPECPRPARTLQAHTYTRDDLSTVKRGAIWPKGKKRLEREYADDDFLLVNAIERLVKILLLATKRFRLLWGMRRWDIWFIAGDKIIWLYLRLDSLGIISNQ